MSVICAQSETNQANSSKREFCISILHVLNICSNKENLLDNSILFILIFRNKLKSRPRQISSLIQNNTLRGSTKPNIYQNIPYCKFCQIISIVWIYSNFSVLFKSIKLLNNKQVCLHKMKTRAYFSDIVPFRTYKSFADSLLQIYYSSNILRLSSLYVQVHEKEVKQI